MLDRLHPSRRRHKVALLALAMLGLAACAGGADEEDYVERPVEDLYNAALDSLLNDLPREASRGFDEVERQHPYSEWATRAQLMSAYALYEANAYDEAVDAARRFIDLHPGHKDVAYAHYLIGVCYYEQHLRRRPRSANDRGSADRVFEELIRRFPDSAYARDAQLKADLARDHLAGKEMEIGRYYLERGKYVAAINRFRNVVERFQTTTHVAEALHRLTEAYLALGVEPEAQTDRRGARLQLPEQPLVRRQLRPAHRRDRPAAPAGRRGGRCAGRGHRPTHAVRLERHLLAGCAGRMLTSLAIRDVVLIDRLDLELMPGLCVLTGETGAGKSILLDALGLALGARGRAAPGPPRRPAGLGQRDLRAWPMATRRAPCSPSTASRPRASSSCAGCSAPTVAARAFVNDQPVGVGLLAPARRCCWSRCTASTSSRPAR